MRLNVSQSISSSVNVKGVSVYGTDANFRGQAKPGGTSFVDASWEYSMTRSWVLAPDATYRYQNSTRVTGSDGLASPDGKTWQRCGSRQALSERRDWLCPGDRIQLEFQSRNSCGRARDSDWPQHCCDDNSRHCDQHRPLSIRSQISSVRRPSGGTRTIGLRRDSKDEML